MDAEDIKRIKQLLDHTLEAHLAAIHEEITDLGTGLHNSIGAVQGDVVALQEDLGALRVEVADGFMAVTSKLGGLDNRIDDETFARKDLEQRVRKVLPDLAQATRP